MDIHKLAHDASEAAKHLPLFIGLISSIRITPKMRTEITDSDLGEVPGDNILPINILNSLSSRRGL